MKLSSPEWPRTNWSGPVSCFSSLTEPWTLFHRRLPLSLPLSSALLSHPETDHLRQWDESRRRSETKRERILEKRGPAPALLSLMGVGEIRPLIGCLRCRFPSWVLRSWGVAILGGCRLRFGKTTPVPSRRLERESLLSHYWLVQPLVHLHSRNSCNFLKH